MRGREIEIIKATLKSLEDDEEQSKTLRAKLKLKSEAPRGRPQTGAKSSTSSSTSPAHLDAQHPNPNVWKPTSHYPRKKSLEAVKAATPKKDKISGPLIDKFIEEIADLVSKGDTPDELAVAPAKENPRVRRSSDGPVVTHSDSDGAPSISLDGGGENQEDDKDRKARVTNQLYRIFSKVTGDSIDNAKAGDRDINHRRRVYGRDRGNENDSLNATAAQVSRDRKRNPSRQKSHSPPPPLSER